MDTYQDCVDYLFSLISYETRPHWTYNNKSLNLERFKSFLARLGHPQDDLRIIHVAGSDGKGSTCAMISAVLQHLGYKTALYTSPHLHSVRERIQVNRQWIPKDRFIDYTRLLRRELEAFSPHQSGFATFFELLTAMAFLYFRESKVDFSVIETGLGGRLDATNTANPILCVITHISLEHTDKLGDTLEAIADEKLGIIRPTSPVIVGYQEPGLLPHFVSRLAHHPAGAELINHYYSIVQSRVEPPIRKIDFRTPQQKLVSLSSPLMGYYQTYNAVTAYSALKTLSRLQWIENVSDQAVSQGLLHTQWEGRFEVIERAPVSIVLDIAHTVKAAAALKRSLQEVFPDKDRIFILGFSQDKNFTALIEHLCDPADRLWLTQAPTPRAVSIETLQQKCAPFESRMRIQYQKDPALSLTTAIRIANEHTVIVIAGSLYLVSDIRKTLLSLPGE